MSNPNIETARTYASVGFIFYILSAIGGLIGVLAFLFVVIGFPFFAIIGSVFFLLFIPGILLAMFAWITVRDIDRGVHGRARTNSLILGILGLFFGLLIGGIFFLLAYSKLGESTAHLSPTRFCVNCGRAVSSDAKFCSNCGKELPP
jgi:hypothetical protein